ncbi:hypothetical protein DFH06DRAFT_1124812 [Mycena polygramma]|nr:hypothetical protein DFH06DRAFT_1124812 [Mycena polygramma]
MSKGITVLFGVLTPSSRLSVSPARRATSSTRSTPFSDLDPDVVLIPFGLGYKATCFWDTTRRMCTDGKKNQGRHISIITVYPTIVVKIRDTTWNANSPALTGREVPIRKVIQRAVKRVGDISDMWRSQRRGTNSRVLHGARQLIARPELTAHLVFRREFRHWLALGPRASCALARRKDL